MTPSNIKLGISSAVNSLSPGVYNASAVIDGGKAKNSPASVNVSLRVIYAGTVKVQTNLKEAGFEIIPTGVGTTYSGTGTEWTNDEVTPGDYTITFKHVSGYIKPYTRAFTVKTGKETTIDGTYRVKPAATHIIAGSGGTKGKKVAILTLGGLPITTFEPFKSPKSIKTAAGDLDASGTDKIVVTDHKRKIKVYTHEGAELALLELAEGYTRSVIAVADIDNDGKAEIIVGVKNDPDDDAEDDADNTNEQREIKLYRYDNGKLAEGERLYTENKNKEFRIALGDINGDGWQELIIADEDDIRAFEINLEAQNKLKEIWKVGAKGIYEDTPEIATGDLNDDGIYEIALGIEQEGKENKEGEKGQKDKKAKKVKKVKRVIKTKTKTKAKKTKQV